MNPSTLTCHALRSLCPRLLAGKDYTVDPDGSIASWSSTMAQPTSEQLATAKATIQAQADARNALKTARAQMASAFAALPTNTRAGLLVDYAAINAALDRGDIVAARAAVGNVERPASSELSEAQFSAMKAQFVSLFP